MRNNYTANVPFEIGVKLKEAGYWNPGCTYDSSYNGPCYVINSKKFYADGVVAPWDDIVPAPTYAEVFDWFASEKYIVITLEPFHTFALKERIGYTWKIVYPDYELGGLVLRSEDDEWDSSKGFGGSFKLTANDAIENAMTITVPVYEFVEVDMKDL